MQSETANKSASASDTCRTRTTFDLTDRFVRGMAPDGGRQVWYDRKVSGFGIRLTPAGTKSFVLNYVTDGKERRTVIGRFPDWSVAAARQQAQSFKRDVCLGRDPLHERQARRAIPSLADLWARYEAAFAHAKRQSTLRNERSVWRRLILPTLGLRKVTAITPHDVDSMHAEISLNSPIQANRVVASLRRVFNVAKRWRLLDINPAAGVALNQECPRNRFLSAGEAAKLLTALDRRKLSASALALRFMLFTGCRRGEALKAEWDQFDLSTGIWTKPSSHTKQKREHRVPLSGEAMRTLQIARDLGGGRFVFPSPITGRAMTEIKKTFGAVCREAEIDGLRVHDLRHTYASFLASGGVGLQAVGQLLGHTQLVTTARYAHLCEGILREATELASSVIERGQNG